MRYYYGDRTLSLTITEPAPVVPVVLPDWPLYLVSANETGTVVYKVPCLDASLYTKPENIIAAYVPGDTINPALTGEQVLALPGVVQVSTPFPASFGVGFDQSVSVVLPAPLPVGPVVVVLLGQVA